MLKKTVLSILLAAQVGLAQAELLIEDGYVRAPLPGRYMSAAFMTFNNTGKQDVVLKSASIQGAGLVEYHTHSHENGVMRMRQIQELKIPAGEKVVLEPGGLHLMVFKIGQLPVEPYLSVCDGDGRCWDQKIAKKELITR